MANQNALKNKYQTNEILLIKEEQEQQDNSVFATITFLSLFFSLVTNYFLTVYFQIIIVSNKLTFK